MEQVALRPLSQLKKVMVKVARTDVAVPPIRTDWREFELNSLVA
jgi:hypothetical protein